MSGETRDFFVYCASQDQAWAEWIVDCLEQNGYCVEIGIRDWAADQDFVTAIETAMGRANGVIALYSKEYFKRPFVGAEQRITFPHAIKAKQPRVIPVLIERCAIPALYKTLIEIDLVNVDQEEAVRRLLQGVSAHRSHPREVNCLPVIDRLSPGTGLKTPYPGTRGQIGENIFLCYSSGDKPEVRALYHQLTADRFKCWLDEEDILPGQSWEYEISKAIRTCRYVLACISKSSVSKAGYVQRELRKALEIAEEQPEGSIFLLPVRLDDCDVPESLRRLQWVDLFEDHGYERLLRALRF